jgi:hypothetical protein
LCGDEETLTVRNQHVANITRGLGLRQGLWKDLSDGKYTRNLELGMIKVSVELDFIGTECNDFDWILLAQDLDQWPAIITVKSHLIL